MIEVKYSDLKVGDVIVGDYSNATYTVTDISDEPIKSIIVITAPKPLNAEPNGAFGFSETITEYPDTL